MLISEKELTILIMKALVYPKTNLIGSDNNMYLTVNSLIKLKNLITGSNNITLRKINVKPYGFDKMYMDKVLTKDNLYQIIDQYSERTITPVKFYSILLNETYPFYYGNGRICKILFPNDDKINKFNNYKNNII